ncbi:MAG: ATP-binding protein [Candidatus Eisenbacteria bacterium]
MAAPERHGPASTSGPLAAGKADPSRQVLLTIPSRLEMLAVLDQLVQALVHQYDFDEDVVNAVATSIIEAGTNAIQHGHHERAELPVHFRFLVQADRFGMGRGLGRDFDLGAVLSTDPTGPEGLLNSRGRGIHTCGR